MNISPADELAVNLASVYGLKPVSRLAAVRVAKGLPQNAVAAAVGIHPMHLSKLERGVNVPCLVWALRLSAFFGVTVNDLWSLPPAGEKPEAA